MGFCGGLDKLARALSGFCLQEHGKLEYESVAVALALPAGSSLIPCASSMFATFAARRGDKSWSGKVWQVERALNMMDCVCRNAARNEVVTVEQIESVSQLGGGILGYLLVLSSRHAQMLTKMPLLGCNRIKNLSPSSPIKLPMVYSCNLFKIRSLAFPHVRHAM